MGTLLSTSAFAAIWITGIIYGTVKSARRLRGRRRICAILGGALIHYGAAGFFACSISSSTTLPTNLNWPMGRADQIIPLADGHRIAVNTPAARIQIYDKNWNFIRGWSVPAGGGHFTAQLTSDGNIYVQTARGNRHLLFSRDGEALPAPEPPQDRAVDGLDSAGYVPTFLPLWVFAHPIVGWSVALVGMLILYLADPQQFSRAKKS